MVYEQLTPDNSAMMMIDYGVGFANVFRSHELGAHVNNVVALAKSAKAFGVPLVVTGGEDDKPSGPIYPELAEIVGNGVIRREGNFDAFRTAEFEAAVAATGRRKLVMAGLMTEGCVLQTALGALRRDYEVYVVADASAGESVEAHRMALLRMTQLGVVPVTWLSLATEYQASWSNSATVKEYTQIVAQHSSGLAMGLRAYRAAAALV